jgi:integrase/recombinase XerD
MAWEPELRNQAIITLLWDLDARPHEITALRIKDIVLNEQYGGGRYYLTPKQVVVPFY